MNEIKQRAKEHYPSVLLTFLSIVQALALELWWSSMQENEQLWNGGWVAWISWAQYLVVLLGILEVWLVYTSMVMRFIWLPGFQDTLFPFAVGIVEFSMVALTGPEHLPAWLCVLGLIFAMMVGSSHQTFIQARREAENDPYFADLKPATASDFKLSALLIAGIFAMALLLLLTQDRGALALGCVAICAGILIHQINDTRQFWNKSMGNPG